MGTWAIISGLAGMAGFIFMVLAWIKRERPWAPKVFWLGVILILIPFVSEVIRGVADEAARHAR